MASARVAYELDCPVNGTRSGSRRHPGQTPRMPLIPLPTRIPAMNVPCPSSSAGSPAPETKSQSSVGRRDSTASLSAGCVMSIPESTTATITSTDPLPCASAPVRLISSRCQPATSVAAPDTVSESSISSKPRKFGSANFISGCALRKPMAETRAPGRLRAAGTCRVRSAGFRWRSATSSPARETISAIVCEAVPSAN